MFKRFKRAIIAFAALMMMVSGITIVEAAELRQGERIEQIDETMEIVPFVSGCFYQVTLSGGVNVFSSSTGNQIVGSLARGTQVWGTPSGNRIRIGTNRYINQHGIGIVSCS